MFVINKLDKLVGGLLLNLQFIFPGFTCRCGGLFCSVHRYSNEHRCTFDYRNLGAEEIRRNNPVIKGEKIQKIWDDDGRSVVLPPRVTAAAASSFPLRHHHGRLRSRSETFGSARDVKRKWKCVRPRNSKWTVFDARFPRTEWFSPSKKLFI